MSRRLEMSRHGGSSDRLTQLPEELSVRILRAVPREDWQHFAQVCKPWRDLFRSSRQLWKVTRLFWDATEANEFLAADEGARAWFARRASRIQRLRVCLDWEYRTEEGRQAARDDLTTWPLPLGALQPLRLQALELETSPDGQWLELLTAVSSMTALEMLRSKGFLCKSNAVLNHFQNLRSLRELFIEEMILYRGETVIEESYEGVIQNLRGLQKLGFGSYSVPSEHELRACVARLVGLKELDLSATNLYDIDLRALTNLSTLHCSYVHPEPDPNFEHMFLDGDFLKVPLSLTALVLKCGDGQLSKAIGELKLLRSLVLQHTSFDVHGDFRNIVGKLRQLERLELFNCSIHDDFLNLAWDTDLPKLRVLNILSNDIKGLEDSPLLAQLEVLQLLSSATRPRHLSAAQSLKLLDICDQTDLQDSDMQVLQSLPKLQEVHFSKEAGGAAVMAGLQQKKPNIVCRFSEPRDDCRPASRIGKNPDLLPLVVEPSSCYQMHEQ